MHTYQTVPTQFIDANGTKLAYRRLGKAGGVPLVFFQHFTGNLDNWDPKVVDAFAADREVILFNNAGVASSEGEVAETYEAMAVHGVNLIKALGLTKVDLLGFSMGGGVAQVIALEHPDLVRKVILVGIGPRNGEGMQEMTPEAQAAFTKQRDVADEIWLDVLFSPSESSQAAGRRFLDRIRARTDRDAAVSDKVAPVQLAAIGAWAQPKGERFAYLKQIKHPVLVVNGNNDIIVPTINSYILQQNLPNATLILYPDSNHGSQYQYPDQFTAAATRFLND
jgi:pimeloyl-ACP methyl ester carboxylesterase